MSRRRQSPGAERQEWYRTTHPQINVTFRDPDEHRRVQWALARHHRTAREVLLAWADAGGPGVPPPAPGSPVTSDSAPAPSAPAPESPVTSDSTPAPSAPAPAPGQRSGRRPPSPARGPPAPVPARPNVRVTRETTGGAGRPRRSEPKGARPRCWKP